MRPSETHSEAACGNILAMAAWETSLITAGATLSGVAITALLAAGRERRQYREERQRERARVAEERWKWLRAERRQAYAALVNLGFQAATTLVEGQSRQDDPDVAAELETRLDELEDAIYAQVADVQLVGSEAVLTAAYALRRSVRRTSTLLGRSIRAAGQDETDDGALSEKVRTVYGATHALVEAATDDLRVPPEPSDPEPGTGRLGARRWLGLRRGSREVAPPESA